MKEPEPKRKPYLASGPGSKFLSLTSSKPKYRQNTQKTHKKMDLTAFVTNQYPKPN